MCRWAVAITSNSPSSNASPTAPWNGLLMLSTKVARGHFQCRGCSSRSVRTIMSKPCLNGWPGHRRPCRGVPGPACPTVPDVVVNLRVGPDMHHPVWGLDWGIRTKMTWLMGVRRHGWVGTSRSRHSSVPGVWPCFALPHRIRCPASAGGTCPWFGTVWDGVWPCGRGHVAGAQLIRDVAAGTVDMDLRHRRPDLALGAGDGSGRGGLFPGAAAPGAGVCGPVTGTRPTRPRCQPSTPRTTRTPGWLWWSAWSKQACPAKGDEKAAVRCCIPQWHGAIPDNLIRSRAERAAPVPGSVGSDVLAWLDFVQSPAKHGVAEFVDFLVGAALFAQASGANSPQTDSISCSWTRSMYRIFRSVP